MERHELERAAQVAAQAADRARIEILPRFRSVAVETKKDGSPVTEADREAERAIREVLRNAYPDFGLLGEEFGAEGPGDAGAERPDASPYPTTPTWIIDPIDGTVAFSRGIPLFSTLIALVENGEPVVGLIDLPALGERYIATRGGGAHRNGEPVHASSARELRGSLVSHGDPFCFDLAGQRPAFERMAREIPVLRGYTDAFGHAQVISGGVDAMVDFDLNPWDAAATQVLVTEAGGAFELRRQANGKLGIVIGSPALVEQLLGFLSP